MGNMLARGRCHRAGASALRSTSAAVTASIGGRPERCGYITAGARQHLAGGAVMRKCGKCPRTEFDDQARGIGQPEQQSSLRQFPAECQAGVPYRLFDVGADAILVVSHGPPAMDVMAGRVGARPGMVSAADSRASDTRHGWRRGPCRTGYCGSGLPSRPGLSPNAANGVLKCRTSKSAGPSP